MYRWISVVFILHLSLAHVMLSIRLYLSRAVAGVEDVCIKSGFPMVVSFISDTY